MDSASQSLPAVASLFKLFWRQKHLLRRLSFVLFGLFWAVQVGAGQTIARADMPREGQETYALIVQGGPFPFDKDGSIFGNRERLLPVQKRGYYREYTVKTPQVRHRGARRIVCGGPIRQPVVCYYTADHYASFREIVK
ncbi:MAG: ribonuclease [Burkholderiaceae bacterium]